MSFTTRHLHPMFGAEVGGLSIKEQLSPQSRAELVNAIHTYGVVLLRDQELEESVLESFARSLGPIWTYSFVTKNSSGLSAATKAVYRYTNRVADGTLVKDDHPTMITLKANLIWHSDATYTKPGATVSIFAGSIIPPDGGNTEFCDTRVAYERLSPAMRDRIRDLSAYHSIIYSNRRVTGKTLSNNDGELTPIRRAVVRKHVTGRDALCIGSHVGRMDGISDAECEDILSELTAVATARDVVYSHQWRPGDVLLWDNHCTMHRATPYDSSSHERQMWITRIRDESET